MVKKVVLTESTFELSFYTKHGAARITKIYERMGYSPVSSRESDGKVWVTYRETKSTDPRNRK